VKERRINKGCSRHLTGQQGRKTIFLEIERSIVRSAVVPKEKNNSAIWKICPLSEKEKDFISSLIAGEEWASGHRQVLSQKRNWIGSHLIREPLGTRGLKEGAVGQ
jgi:hypothetical protein